MRCLIASVVSSRSTMVPVRVEFSVEETFKKGGEEASTTTTTTTHLLQSLRSLHHAPQPAVVVGVPLLPQQVCIQITNDCAATTGLQGKPEDVSGCDFKGGMAAAAELEEVQRCYDVDDYGLLETEVQLERCVNITPFFCPPVCLSVCLSVCSLSLNLAQGIPIQTDGWMDGWMDGLVDTWTGLHFQSSVCSSN